MLDLVVIGGGTAGLTAARLVARGGKKVALVERDRPGGDCLWTGCVPSKALIHIAKLHHEARTSARFGVHTTGVRLDFDAARRHVAEAQKVAGRLDSAETVASWGVELVHGEARFINAQTVEAGGRKLTAKQFLIAAGGRPAVPAIPGLADAGFDTNIELLDWRTLPESLVIVGGGPMGVEFGQMMARFGVRVTIVQSGPRLLPREEPQASELLARTLAGEGIEVIVDARVSRVTTGGNQRRLEVDTPAGPRVASAERLLVATGRTPNIEGLALDAAGVRSTAKGITVDAQLRTSQSHIFAAGDVNGGPQFTHVAEDQARTVARSILHGDSRFRRPPRWNGRVIPRVTYTDPEVASVGLSEEAARRQRKGVRTWTLSLTEVDRAVTMGATGGFFKLVTARGWQGRIPGLSKQTGDEIVGACFVGPNAGDLLMPVVMAMRARLPVGLVAWNMQAYPTLALGLRQVAGMSFDA